MAELPAPDDIAGSTLGSSILEPPGPNQELSGRSREILDILADYDGQAAVLYEGALRVLADGENPARIRLAACALRELLDDFQDGPKGENLKVRVTKLKGAWEVAQRSLEGGPDAGGSGFAVVLDSFFVEFEADYPQRRSQAGATVERLDPSGRSSAPVVQRARGDRWMDFSGYFSRVLHGGARPAEADFRTRVDAFEDFLTDVLRPHTFADFDDLDDVIASGPPDG
jgi:hypothetical protein